ncbi:hypothetical protein [Bacillus sp. HMF5848]|uniref:hypothetical protein n=1 Tax=Bacillus sp. HMF5848 TaxID=2495421 RepID=UPI000F77540F|nr:hypothetical protein [Bacillus sp. HMF5848]
MYKIALSLVFLLTLCACTASGDDATQNKENPTTEEQATTETGNNNEQNDGVENNEEDSDGSDNESKDNDEKTGETDKTNEDNTLTNETVINILPNLEKRFMTVVQSADENGKISNFSTIEELTRHFSEIMSQQVARAYATTYFQEKGDGLYVIAMDAPTWFKADEPFEISQEKGGTYTVIQEQQNEMIGHVKMYYTLVNTNGNWIVEDIRQESLNQ